MKTLILSLVGTALLGQNSVAPPQLNGPQTVSLAHVYDVVLNYHGSGSATTTTISGTLNSNATGATVASCASFTTGAGFYIMIPGAGAAGANFIDPLISCTGTTMTWTDATSTTVSSPTIYHDDTAAINSAIAAAFNAGGGFVYFRSTGVDGVYRCSASANGTTNGILTFPQNLVYQNVATVRLIGEVQGQLAASGLNFVSGSGVGLDFSRAPNTGGTYAISTAPFVAATSGNFTTIFEPVSVAVDNLSILLPPSTQVGGLLFSNAMQAQIGDKVGIFPRANTSGTWATPTGGVGVYMPQGYNNVTNSIGEAVIAFFNIALVPGDHLRLDKPYLTSSANCLAWYNHNFDVVVGSATCEGNTTLIYVDSTVDQAPIDLTLDVECGNGAFTNCNSSVNIIDASNKLNGTIRYKITNGPFIPITLSGAQGVQFTNLMANGYAASGASPASCGIAARCAVAIPTGVNPTLVVDTTAVTARSVIMVTPDSSLTISGTTCNTTLASEVIIPAVTARTAGTSLTLSYSGTISTNPVCVAVNISN